MNVATFSRAWIVPGVVGMGAGCLLALLTGCASGPGSGSAVRDPVPGNVFRLEDRLPRGLKRVALLPLAVHAPEAHRSRIREGLQPVLAAELGKAGRFEVVTVEAGRLRQWTGQGEWRSTDRLPVDFFERLREETGCDGVLFGEVTEYRAYPPIAVGWRWQLVDTDGPTVWWAVDEVFDAGEPGVAAAARRYQGGRSGGSRSGTDGGDILNSPTRFGRYTASLLVATCPGR
ncbi:MAG: hypothetical protein KF833_00160 [Verrucomicrobiae bacterium]|nr:hypothetical protein [Verrucomicrobiae bacterium]